MVAQEPGSAESAIAKKINADATKDFFVTMITRDISLRDCIFDLLDNAIDGARRSTPSITGSLFTGREVRLELSPDRFMIEDNCGGIRLSDAIDYAFHFGRRANSPADVKGGIGLYGIGMKRAIFKIGRECVVTSHADDASFQVLIDVSEWETKPEWDFDYEDIERSNDRGTKIVISQINGAIREMFGDSVFINQLVKDLARDYAFFIQNGLLIHVNGETVPSFRYQLRQSQQVEPAVDHYADDGVEVRILAGIVDEIPDDIPDELRPDKVDRYGWFVVCNDRVVLAADKGDQTIWGVDGFNVWHPQYNGFAGFVFFQAEDQRKLPWTTTKRELDASSPLYRRTVVRMKALTESFIEYTNRRKHDLGAAKAAEAPRALIEVSQLRQPQRMRLPSVSEGSARPEYVNILYKREKGEVNEIKKHLGNIGMSAKDVGIKTFEYFREMELGK